MEKRTEKEIKAELENIQIQLINKDITLKQARVKWNKILDNGKKK